MNSLYIAVNILRRTLLQRRGFLLYLLIPAGVISLIIGIMGQQGDNRVTIAYINADRGTLGAYLIEELSTLQDYRLTPAVAPASLRDQVMSKQANAGLLIPEGFSEALFRSDEPQVDLYQLSLNENTITLKWNLDEALSRLRSTIGAHKQQGASQEALLAAVEQTISQQMKHQVSAQVTDYQLYVNPMMHVIIGFMLMFMMGLINNTVTVIMEDRRQRTLARTYAAPVRALEIVLGNFLGSFLVGTLQVLLILIVTRYVMNFTYGLPFFSQFVILEFFLLASMGIASSVAGMVKSAMQMSVVNSLVVTPTCMLGGCFWPIGLMPQWMQKLANFVPQTWAIDAIQRMASGQILSDMWMHMSMLALFALILLGVGSVILRPGEDELA